jgi:DNA-binding SARP family transcriptional activator/TolB-like protein
MGEFSIRTENGGPVALPFKARALAAYLALQDGRAVKREVIGELLWPERGEQQSRNSLKQELYILRRDGFAGADVIGARDNALCLPPDSISCDVHDLRKLLQHPPGATWQAIVGLYTGPLLDGFPAVSPEFDDWLATMRQALQTTVLDALQTIAENDGEQHTLIAERMLAIDPLREDTQRLLIRAYADAGRRADAIRIYTEAKSLLRRELDISPAAETEALIRRVRDDRSSHTVPPIPGRTGPPRIAVLPLRQSEDQKLPSHLSDGITGDIITQLAGLRELTVISHGSTYSFRDPHATPQEIGRKLDARYLVLGRIRRGGDRLRLTTELTEAETGQIIYSRTDDAHETLSFDDQDRIVAQLVNALVPQVRETELRRIRGKRPKVLSVYEKILLSREQIMMLNRDGFATAKTLLDEVIEEDPGYGEAYALAADWHGIMLGERWSADRETDIAAVERLSSTALSLDQYNVRALVSYAHRRSQSHRDQSGAMRMFQQALDVAPSSANAWALSGLCAAYAGEAADAVRRATRAFELSPYDKEMYKFCHALCVAHYTAGDYEQAVHWGRRALSERTVWEGTRGFTAASLSALGRLPEAREITARLAARSPGRRISAVLNDLAYQDKARLRLYGEHLRAAGYPD